MEIQQKILQFILYANWIILLAFSSIGFFLFERPFFNGVFVGGLIVTINFHLLYRTLKRAFTPPHISSHHLVLAKYYLRFTISGFIIFFLLCYHIVNPIGLVLGLSVVVVSVLMATFFAFTKYIMKEAV